MGCRGVGGTPSNMGNPVHSIIIFTGYSIITKTKNKKKQKNKQKQTNEELTAVEIINLEDFDVGGASWRSRPNGYRVDFLAFTLGALKNVQLLCDSQDSK